MSEMTFCCPWCEQHMECDDQLSGREMQCPTCHHLIHIPPAPGKADQYDSEEGRTWSTFIPPANLTPPPGLSLGPKNNPPPPSQ